MSDLGPRSRTLLLALVIGVGLAAFAFGIVAIASNWNGAARVISFLVAFSALPLALRTHFPETARHMRTTFTVAGCVLVVLVAIFLIRFGWLTRQAHRPVVKIGVSLPFFSDASDAGPMYDAIKMAFSHMSGPGVRRIDDRTLEIHGQRIKLVPFDDSTIGDADWSASRGCRITFVDSDGRRLGSAKAFSHLTNDPQVVAVIGPFNSGVAVSEIPATNKARIPLVSPANAADCLTSTRYADGICDPARWGDNAYFRVATPDSVRQKALADYLWSNWKERHPATTPRIVIFKESGPRADTFSNGAAQRFSEAWLQHAGVVAPAVYPLAVASTDGDLQASLSRLTFVPDIVVYAGTRNAGARLYRALGTAGLPDAIFAGPGSLQNSDYERYIRDARSGPLYAVDFASGTSPRPPGVPDITEFRRPWLFGATSYDAAMICLRSIQSVLDDQRHSAINNFSFRARVGLAARPLHLGLERSFRKQVISKIRWLNTGAPGSVEYHGVTGTYSFNGNDADGAAGVTIWAFDKTDPEQQWKAVKTSAPQQGG